MHIITRRRLREFWAEYPNAEKPLRIWHQICERSEFGGFAELRNTFNSVDKVGKFTVFDIGGNKWRLVTVVHYSTGKIYIRDVLTHAQYDQDDWKREN